MAVASPVASRGTVLIVDDEAFIARAVACLLTQLRGAEVHVATDSDQALALARRLRADLVLVDVHMPGTCSVALCRQLRELDHLREVPIYVFTGLLPDEADVAPLLALCDGLISKPPDPVELTAALDAALWGDGCV